MPRASMIRAMPDMPAPPMPTKWTRPSSSARTRSVDRVSVTGDSDLVTAAVGVDVLAHPVRRAGQTLAKTDLRGPAGPLAGTRVVGQEPVDLAAVGTDAGLVGDDRGVAARDL